jgi:hypothetical protein
MVTSCACGATTEGEPFANGWGRHVSALDCIEWVCNHCSVDHLLLRMSTEWTLADAVEHEESLP